MLCRGAHEERTTLVWKSHKGTRVRYEQERWEEYEGKLKQKRDVCNRRENKKSGEKRKRGKISKKQRAIRKKYLEKENFERKKKGMNSNMKERRVRKDRERVERKREENTKGNCK